MTIPAASFSEMSVPKYQHVTSYSLVVLSFINFKPGETQVCKLVLVFKFAGLFLVLYKLKIIMSVKCHKQALRGAKFTGVLFTNSAWRCIPEDWHLYHISVLL